MLIQLQQNNLSVNPAGLKMSRKYSLIPVFDIDPKHIMISLHLMKKIP